MVRAQIETLFIIAVTLLASVWMRIVYYFAKDKQRFIWGTIDGAISALKSTPSEGLGNTFHTLLPLLLWWDKDLATQAQVRLKQKLLFMVR